MSRFFNEHPELAEEIAGLPMSEQNAAIRDAMHSVYDPDRIREEFEERIHHHRPLNTSAGGDSGASSGSGSTPPAVDPYCDSCGAPTDEGCQWWCHGEAIS